MAPLVFPLDLGYGTRGTRARFIAGFSHDLVIHAPVASDRSRRDLRGHSGP